MRDIDWHDYTEAVFYRNRTARQTVDIALVDPFLAPQYEATKGSLTRRFKNPQDNVGSVQLVEETKKDFIEPSYVRRMKEHVLFNRYQDLKELGYSKEDAGKMVGGVDILTTEIEVVRSK